MGYIGKHEPNEFTVWARIGMGFTLTWEEYMLLRKVARGNCSEADELEFRNLMLRKIRNNEAIPDGDCYIPQAILEEELGIEADGDVSWDF